MYIDVYKDKSNEWRWRFRGSNNETMADSSEGYKNREDMFSAMEQVCGGWTSSIVLYDAADQKQSIPVFNRHDGTSIHIRDVDNTATN